MSWGHLYNGNTPALQAGNRGSIPLGSTNFWIAETSHGTLKRLITSVFERSYVWFDSTLRNQFDLLDRK